MLITGKRSALPLQPARLVIAARTLPGGMHLTALICTDGNVLLSVFKANHAVCSDGCANFLEALQLSRALKAWPAAERLQIAVTRPYVQQRCQVFLNLLPSRHLSLGQLPNPRGPRTTAYMTLEHILTRRKNIEVVDPNDPRMQPLVFSSTQLLDVLEEGANGEWTEGEIKKHAGPIIIATFDRMRQTKSM